MTEARIEEDPGHIDPDDMNAIIGALEYVAVTAETAPSATTDPHQDWTLTLHWLQNGPVSSDTEAALPHVLTRIREHYTLNGTTPPARLELHDHDHRVLATITPPSEP
ncbi:hypothetical protein [Streptacidiphilus sp. P02-A3a]|uniref:hypothetical protein n=1 Tax=Streptacidiphilus sp. P02-A3a TaxID=2704468 RepID=UPI0015FD398D|nr:hypothetical protein [Streptacidiphilus sp. P02-A3a]QMU70768.1 hypothetical protein GXP74_23705 [Streptacidiphilus sp. P02-A3a]